MANARSALRQAWKYGCAIRWVGLTFFVIGFVACIALSIWYGVQAMPWSYAAVMPGLLLMGYANIYLTGLECPFCQTSLRMGRLGSFENFRYCSRCGRDLAPELKK
jgi:hypothetical protein